MRLLLAFAWLGLASCTGQGSPGGSLGGTAGAASVGAAGSAGMPAIGTPDDWKPVDACAPTPPPRVSRLSDRHLANALRDVLGLPLAPDVKTSSSGREQFLPNKPAPINGSVAIQLRDLVENLASEATAPGQPLVTCAGDEAACAASALDHLGRSAFRRPLTTAERTGLEGVYALGRQQEGTLAGGLRWVVEAVLQAPSFVYQTELGSPGPIDRVLAPSELAAKLSFFLRDGLPDAELAQAADRGELSTDEQVARHVDRLLATEEVKANISKIFVRLFDFERLLLTNKADSVSDFTPDLVRSMQEESKRFIDATLWKRDASLRSLLTSRETFIDDRLAKIYGMAPVGPGFVPATLPAERAGILTQAALMTMEASPAESSVVHRGVFVVRELLCFHPAPPGAGLLAIGEELKKTEPTERGRAERRAEMPICAACHANFDPFGVAFEHYDTLGRYRTSIALPQGSAPVDSSWDYSLYDMKGKVLDAVELSARLGESAAVRECVTRQLASYALGQRLTDAQACTIGELARQLDANDGNLLGLVRNVATWPGLRHRSLEVAP